MSVKRLEAVRVVAGNVDRDRIVVPDVLGEGLARLPVEHDDSRRSPETCEEIVLPPLVEVQTPDDPRARERQVRLHHRLRQAAVPAQLREPAAIVGVDLERDALDPVDHGETLFTPVSSITPPISARCCQCLPASSHQPSTSCAWSLPSSA